VSRPHSPPPPGPAYRLTTPRTLLRPWCPEDAPALVVAVGDSLTHLRPWMGWAQERPDVEATVARLRHLRAEFDADHDFTYGVWEPSGQSVIGGCGLHPRIGAGALEIGYWLHVDHAGRGLATEFAAALTRAAFAFHRVHRVEIHCDPLNVASARVAEKLGYRHEATLTARLQRPDGTWRDTMIWTMFAERFASSPAAVVRVTACDALGRPMDPSLPT